MTVRHTMRPSGKFSTITALGGSGSPRPATVIASRRPIQVITIESTRMLAQSGFLARIFEVFGRPGTSVDVVATAEVSVSLTVEASAPIDAIKKELGAFAKVSVAPDRALVALVGERLKQTPGLAARVFGSLSSINVAWKVGRDHSPPEGVNVDVAIDASTGSAVDAHLGWALQNGIDLVIGATGWSIPDLKERVGDRISVVVAPNFSLSVALYARLGLVMARFAALDPARDPYIVEHHHARKKDAPSGTAKLLANVLLKGCPRKTEWTLQGPGELKEHQLSVSAIRAGHTYSSHVVGIDAPAETLELHHAARAAMAYADGALRVAAWVHGRKGVFTMDQFSAEALDPLFREVKP